MKENNLPARFLVFFLILSFMAPSSAWALRIQTGGLEERTLTVRQLEKELLPQNILSATGLEESRRGIRRLLVIGMDDVNTSRTVAIARLWRPEMKVTSMVGIPNPNPQLFGEMKGSMDAVLLTDSVLAIGEPFSVMGTGAGEFYLDPRWSQEVGRVLQEQGIPMGVIREVRSVTDEDIRILLGKLDQKLRSRSAGLEEAPVLQENSFVRAVAFSPDGRTLISGQEDSRLSLWDVSTGKRLWSFQTFQDELANQKGVSGVAFSSDGTVIAASLFDGTLLLVNAASGKILKERRFPQRTWAVAFSSDGRIVASAGRPGVWLWDTSRVRVASSYPVTGENNREFLSVAFNPDGTRLAAGGADGVLSVWEVASGKSLGRFQVGRAYGINSVAFNPDGNALASGNDYGEVRIWSVADGSSQVIDAGWGNPVRSVVFSPDGRRLAEAGVDGIIRLWELPSGSPWAEFTGHAGVVQSLAISPDGKTLASGGNDETIRLRILSDPSVEQVDRWIDDLRSGWRTESAARQIRAYIVGRISPALAFTERAASLIGALVEKLDYRQLPPTSWRDWVFHYWLVGEELRSLREERIRNEAGNTLRLLDVHSFFHGILQGYADLSPRSRWVRQILQEGEIAVPSTAGLEERQERETQSLILNLRTFPLSDSERAARAETIQSLVKEQSRAVPFLLAALRVPPAGVSPMWDEWQHIREGVMEVLAQIKPSTAPIIEELSRIVIRSLNEPELRYSAVAALGEIADPRAMPALVLVLGDEDPVTQSGSVVVDAFVRIGLPAVPALRKVLRNQSHRNVQEGAAEALTGIVCAQTKRNPAVVSSVMWDFIRTLKREKRPEIRLALARNLGKIGRGNSAVVSVLKRILADPNEDDLEVLVWVTETLGEMGPAAQKAIPAFQKALDRMVFSQDRERLETAIQKATAEIRGESGLEEKVVMDGSGRVPVRTEKLLQELFGPPAAIRDLKVGLEEADAGHRRFLIRFEQSLLPGNTPQEKLAHLSAVQGNLESDLGFLSGDEVTLGLIEPVAAALKYMSHADVQIDILRQPGSSLEKTFSEPAILYVAVEALAGAIMSQRSFSQVYVDPAQSAGLEQVNYPDFSVGLAELFKAA